MAISQIEEKILGKLAKQTEASNSLLAANLYQVLGLSILLSQKLYRAKKLRKLDSTRDTKSLQLYHQIIWLAREGLSITEVYILPYCQDGEQGPECRVMAAKLRASFYHIFCLFHNHPPVNGTRRYSSSSGSPPSSNRSPKQNNGQTGRSSSKSPGNGKGGNGARRRRSSKSGLRDPISSITSDASYITNPFASPTSPPPAEALPPLPPEAHRTPSRPPGLRPIKIPSPQAAASFLLPPLNFVPMTLEHFETTQHLATTLLPPAHALRLASTLEHAAFIWDCLKDHEQARTLAARTIKEVYSSSEGLDDDEFADAAAIVQALGGIVKRGSNESSPNLSNNGNKAQVPRARAPPNLPLIDRTIAISPPSTSTANTTRRPSLDPSPIVHYRSTPDRLSTVPEDPSQETSERENDRATTTAPTTLSPSISRLSSRASGKTGMSSQTDKAAKRRVLEAAEQELYRRRSQSANSRQTTPVEGIGALAAADQKKEQPPPPQQQQQQQQQRSLQEEPKKKPIVGVKPIDLPSRSKDGTKKKIHTKTKERAKPARPPPLVIPIRHDSDPRRETVDRRRAILRALEVIASSSRVLDPKHGVAKRVGVE